MQLIKSDILESLWSYKSSHEKEVADVYKTIDFVEKEDSPFSRANSQGHVTASAWIISPDKVSALLIHHKKLNLWFQPGGHIEWEDETVLAAARREALEESGLRDIELLSPEIFDVDIHTIPEKKEVTEHLHYDIRYVFQAKHLDLAPDMTEVIGIKWIPISVALQSPDTYGTIHRMLQKSIDL